MMWAYRLEGPLTFGRHEIEPPSEADVDDGQVLLRFRTGGVCGSDIARCLEGGTAASPGPFGLSLHEIVGEVVASRSDLEAGTRVVGWVDGSRGLQELVVTGAHALTPVGADMDDLDAVPLQPLACVVHATSRLPDVAGVRAAVIGLGPIGLLMCHALKDRGVAHITGVDPIDRTAIGQRYGVDEVAVAIGRQWAPQNRDRFDLVVEAVGHQVGTMQNAIDVVAPGGIVKYFGNPDDRYYPLDFGQMMDKDVILFAGRTPQNVRRSALQRAQAYVQRHPDVLDGYITHVVGVDDVQKAYDLGATPAPGRLKVVLDGR
jgi:threonine dehydrogenase-like Zn-dependent dehydrogenase